MIQENTDCVDLTGWGDSLMPDERSESSEEPFARIKALVETVDDSETFWDRLNFNLGCLAVAIEIALLLTLQRVERSSAFVTFPVAFPVAAAMYYFLRIAEKRVVGECY